MNASSESVPFPVFESPAVALASISDKHKPSATMRVRRAISWSCVLLTLAATAIVAQTTSPPPSTTTVMTLSPSPSLSSPAPSDGTQLPSLTPSLSPATLPSSPPSLQSTVNLYSDTGIVELCYSPDCNTDAPSLSFSLSTVSINTNMDPTTKTVTSSTVLTDLSLLTATDTDQLITPSPSNGSTRGTLYARACLSSPCVPRASNASEFQRLLTSRDGAIGIELAVHHTERPTSIASPFETYDVASGALRLNLMVAVSPLADQPDALPMFSVTLLVAAFTGGVATTNVSTSGYVDNHMYLQRIHFAPDMFLDLPAYATVNGVDTRIYTAIKSHTSGELQDLVEITLLFGPVTHSIGYAAAFSSDKLVANDQAAYGAGTGSMAATVAVTTPRPTSRFDTPLRDSTGKTLPTRLFAAPRGVFGLCLDATCAADDVVMMGFAGLRVRGSVDLPVSRFANAPAFQFSSPSVATLAGTSAEVLTSFFEASVPQSRLRPPQRYTSGNGAKFSANLAYFLTPGSVPYGGKQLDVPRGAVKFTVEIRDWVFATSSDRLELSMAIVRTNTSSALVNMTSAYTVARAGDTVVLTLEHNKVVEFPTYAIADGSVVPVGVAIDAQDKDGAVLVVTLSFASFAQAVVYDPVIKAVNVTHTGPFPLMEPHKRQVGSWAVAGFLLGFLALVVLVSILQCIKKARVKLDFSKIIP